MQSSFLCLEAPPRESREYRRGNTESQSQANIKKRILSLFPSDRHRAASRQRGRKTAAKVSLLYAKEKELPSSPLQRLKKDIINVYSTVYYFRSEFIFFASKDLFHEQG